MVVGGGWTKTELMLFSTQVEVVVELKLELVTTSPGGWVVGGWVDKNEINAILNSS